MSKEALREELRLLVKRIALTAMFSDDILLERLTLKGGNALQLIYGISTRASLDLDFSMEGDFEEIALLQSRVERCLTKGFGERGYTVVDFKLSSAPPVSKSVDNDINDFWAGYKVEFKIASDDDFRRFSQDRKELQRHFPIIGNNSPKFTIDISKHEYCRDRRSATLNNYTIYAYSPEMIVCEKIRAICQQMPAYAPIVRRAAGRGSARARDFVDVHSVCTRLGVDSSTPGFGKTLQAVFAAKRVPVELVAQIADFREFHRPDFDSVKLTVAKDVKLEGFDFYFDYVVSICAKIAYPNPLGT